MHARLTRVDGSPEQIDAAIEMARNDVMPTLQACAGYKGFTLGADRAGGKLFGISFFDSEENLRASEDAVRQARESTARAAGGSPDVTFYEIGVDDEA